MSDENYSSSLLQYVSSFEIMERRTNENIADTSPQLQQQEYTIQPYVNYHNIGWQIQFDEPSGNHSDFNDKAGYGDDDNDDINDFKKKNTPQKQVVAISKNKKKKRKLKMTDVVHISQSVVSDDNLFLSEGMEFTKGGILRFYFILDQLSLGNRRNQALCINYQIKDQIVEVDLTYNESQQSLLTYEEVINFVMRTQCKSFFDVSAALKIFFQKKKMMQNLAESIKFDSFTEEELENETLKYILSCKEFISEYARQNSNAIFQYTIGRLNFKRGGMKLIKSGYSKSFLDLIGIDVTSFCELVLRNNIIDLIKDEDEINSASLYGVFARQKHNIQNGIQYDCNITTLDGFPLRIHITKKYAFPKYKPKKLSSFPMEYLLLITEFDVNLQDLQNLIAYRRDLMLNNQNLSFENMMRKELSYLFEDVVYSVNSQSFIETFYKENLNELNQLQSEKKTTG